jgi:hypothetical protein
MVMFDESAVIDATKHWLSDVVIRLNLCPFARQPFVAGSMRFRVSQADNEAQLLMDLAAEIAYLTATPTTETTLLIHPGMLNDFLDYNDFLALCDALLVDLSVDGVFQIASFHPHYQFAGTTDDAIENYTNRSPAPMLHLLREDRITEALASYPDPAVIPENNIARLRSLSPDAMVKLKAYTAALAKA